uniref:peptidyl-tRNA hydrolase n=1 Tax=Danio rerio TaxID=7955 RepID=Q5CZM9_DANRE|nr:probable peptidyl-tRNA hydrolase [Danio rerio]AAH90788.1 Peptidyl-tRNA hydrolase 1 homolog (S. cerevisiae) [Danio rerio]AAI65428.1 Ptrh1 protein [Danio rerio]|eukprot:NP_001013348.1 probable peptidyl-tRNA hydrolase [Danio rerio]
MMMSSLPPPKMGSQVDCKKRKMVVGLGNPGMTGSRHSVGMAVLTTLAEHLGAPDGWRSDRKVSGEVVVTQLQDVQLVLLRPKLLMNVNGVSVAKAASRYLIPPEHILLIHDELDKPLGKFGIKHGGSARGHNGVRSCVDCLQTDVMPRLRIGIGRPSDKTPIDRYVLGRFSKEEQNVLDSVMKQSLDVLLDYLTDSRSQTSPAEGRRAAQKKKVRTLSPPQNSSEEQTQS